MRRDGTSPSLWQETTENYRITSQVPSGGQQFDVVIAGAGITGLSTGILLQQAGLSVMIAEAQTVAFGTTGGTTAHLNTFLDTPYHKVIKDFGENNAQLLVKAVKGSLSLIDKNVRDLEIDCNYTAGLPGILFSQNEEQTKELEEILAASKKLGLDVDWTDDSPLSIPFERAIKFGGQASFHPTRYVYALARAFEKAGGVLLQGCRITNVEEGDVHKIHCEYGEYLGRNFIYATHIPPGVNVLHFRCAPYRSYAMACKLRNEKDYPDALVYDMHDPYHYYRTQEIDGELYLIGGGYDHKTGKEENTAACFRKLEAHLRKHFEVESFTHRWSSQYFEPADGLPYIGRLPGHSDNMYVATGYSGNGMVYSGVAAQVLSDMIRTGRSDYEELFDPSRVKMVAGFSNILKESADVVGSLIKKIIPADQLDSLAELARGEARVIKYEGRKLAVYKDEAGEIHAVNAACTHIKCDVAWNNAEKTWDCPCHGSRFGIDGKVLTGPARKNLEQVRLGETSK